jgi:hypothetical protein
VIILISDKVDIKPKLVKRDKEGHFILIKGTMHQEEITIVNLYAFNFSESNFIKHTLLDLKVQLDPNTVLEEDFCIKYAEISQINDLNYMSNS